jgi:hypothetical protein
MITPIKTKKTNGNVSDREEVQTSFHEVMNQYAPALKKLAKN